MASTISLIPYPISLIEKKGFFNIRNNAVVVSNCFDENLDSIIKSLLLKVGLECNFSTSNPDILLNSSDSYKEYSLKDNESYCVDINSENISIYASGKAGIFYAFESLVQLLITYKKNIPCLSIYDKPAYKWRGFLLDTSRSFYTVDFIKKVLDLCAFHKLNTFHWHLTDDQGWRFPVEGYPLLTEIGGKRLAPRKPKVMEGLNEDNSYRRRYYTEEEIKDIVKYADDRFINIVPEVDIPGHSSALLASYPEFGCTGGPYQVEHRWGVFSDILCAGNDNIFKIYDAVFASLEKLFPGKYVHIGGDECRTTRWEKCPKCQQRMKDENLDNTNQLQSWVTKKMVELLEKHGKIPIGWDEVLENTEKIPVPEDLIVQSWRGTEGGEKAVKLNHNVIMSPHYMTYVNYKPYDNFEEPGMLDVITIEKSYTFSPVTEGMSEEDSHLVMGGECALWTEELRSSRMAEYLMFPRLCAIAECLWLKKSDKDYNRFLNNLNEHKKRLDYLDVLYYKGPAK